MPPSSKSALKRKALENASNRTNKSRGRATSRKRLAEDEAEKQTLNPPNPAFEENLDTESSETSKRTRAPASRESQEIVLACANQSRRSNSTAKSSSSDKNGETGTSQDEIKAFRRYVARTMLSYGFRDGTMTSCDIVRHCINARIDDGSMTKPEFAKAIGCTTSSLNGFLKQTGPDAGRDSPAYSKALVWFRQPENMRLEEPDTREQKTGKNKPSKPKATSSTSRVVTATSLANISDVHLDNEETDSVSVWDSCDEIRRKINAHLKTPGVTRSQFCRDLYARLNQPKIKGIQSKQLNDFLRGEGARTGAKSTVFYAAYVYFEKLRIVQGEPKSKHREDMEDIWGWNGGFDRETDNRTAFFVGSNKTGLCFDRYGRTISY